jgi:hypothetical protein
MSATMNLNRHDFSRQVGLTQRARDIDSRPICSDAGHVEEDLRCNHWQLPPFPYPKQNYKQ